MNPFLSPYTTPFGIPPFETIKPEHIFPAFEQGLQQELEEYEAIESNTEEVTFENTLEAMERSGEILKRVLSYFYNLVSAHTNDELDELNRMIGPKLSRHQSRLLMSDKIFARIDFLYTRRESLELSAEQLRLLEEKHNEYVRSGVRLPEDKKTRLKEILSEISACKVDFTQNLLKETNASQLHITKEEDLEGLPSDMIDSAASLAQSKGKEGWLFLATQGTLYAFLTSSVHKHLRHQLYSLYIHRANNGNEHDNNKLACRIARLRLEQVQILGYRTYAEYSLENTMAKNPNKVRALLDRVREPAFAQAKRERMKLQAMNPKEDFAASDWWYYAELLRKKEYDLSNAAIRPYLSVDAVRDGAFAVAEKLFGIRFVERTDLPKYHEDVQSFEVREEDNTLIGIFYVDFFARPSKRGGAWMSVFRGQSAIDENIIPIVVNTCNFPPPTSDAPSLLTPMHVRTLFHEFGHALHGLLSKARFPSLAGTAVPRDYVEFPSQIMENWGRNRDVLREFAKHYQQADTISDELLDKLDKTGVFNMGFRTTEYLAASYLDLAWHELEEIPEDAQDFEKRVLEEIGLIPEIASRYRTTYFSHIFASGYAAGYYSYMWSEVLDSDGFSLFEERGLYHKETAQQLRDLVYASGNTVDVMEQYVTFRGAAPQVEALLKKRGFSD